ncbi:MAG: cation transporter [Planctomycetaceae bacterium]|nr:cation transporter [Planctomycetaceae bacterium]
MVATQTAILGLLINLLLGVVKLVGGILGSSFALISDAVNSLGDVFMSLVVVYALRVAQRPPDDEHPYGHTRAEAIAGSNVALLVIVSALLVGWEAIQRINVQHDLPPVWTLWIAGANILIKEGLYRWNIRIGKRTRSSVVMASAWDHRSDAFCSLAVLIGLGIVRWGGQAWIGADEVAALVVVVAIIWSASQLFRSSASELMDVQAHDELVAQIRQAAEAVPDVREIETLWVRKSGLEYFADIHIEVDQHLTVAEGHEIGHRVKDRLLEQFSMLRDVLVHLEPYPHLHENSKKLPDNHEQ